MKRPTTGASLWQAQPMIFGVRMGRAVLLITDIACWFVATLFMVVARYDFHLSSGQFGFALALPILAGALQALVGLGLKLYSGAARVGSFNEVSLLTLVVLAVSVVVGLPLVALAGENNPRGVVATVPFAALFLMFGVRYLIRAVRRHVRLRRLPSEAEPVLIYGAGNAGTQLAQLLLTDHEPPYRVVGFIDDDPNKRNLHIGTSRVVGRREDLVARAQFLGVKRVILAIPTATSSFMAGLAEELGEANIDLLVLPPVKDMVGGRVQIGHVQPFDFTELLGRAQIKTDLSEIAAYLTGKVVLVTGAGGSIGAEIARQVHAFGPAQLVCLDRDESGLHGTQLSVYGTGLLDTPDMVLCDIRDSDALRRAFHKHRPDVVFHAAALKHLPMLEQYPDEGWRTNVLGTLNVLRAAAEVGVTQFVNIPTDKAADPTSVLGRTKRRAEELTAWFARHEAGSYVSVRFGNVLGSRGSVLWTFAEQIKRGGPVTVVHPDITRFFMTIPEACQLVIQAGAIGGSGEVLVLDMGQPIRILDVAKRLVRDSGKRIDIQFTGLREGEKLHEVLFSDHENPAPTAHPMISAVGVDASDPDEVVEEFAQLFSGVGQAS